MLETGIPCFVQTKFSFNILATKNLQTSVNYFKLVVFLYFFWHVAAQLHHHPGGSVRGAPSLLEPAFCPQGGG